MSGTESLEDKLQSILNDPDAMAQLTSMAQSFGLPTEPAHDQSAQSAAPPEAGMLSSMMAFLQQAGQTDSRQEALLRALKAYLSPERRERMDKAAQLARLSRLAGAALGQSGFLGGKGGT